jgi:hypothetical protein
MKETTLSKTKTITLEGNLPINRLQTTGIVGV